MRWCALFALALCCHAAQVVWQKSIPATLVAVDPSGNIYAAGGATVTKVDSGGNVIYSKTVAVAGNWSAITADAAGNLVIVGDTTSDSLPTTLGVLQPKRNANGVCISGDKDAKQIPCPDAFIAKIDVHGDLAWVTYLGGSAQDYAYGVAADSTGNIYVTGLTQSADFRTVKPFQSTFGGYADAFIAKISADGTQLLYASFVGGAAYDVGKAVSVDAAGNAYVSGVVQGAGLPASPGGFGTVCPGSSSCGFLIKVAPSGDHLVFGGTLGADQSYSEATSVTVDGQGNVYVGGYTNAAGFPQTQVLFPLRNWREFIAKISADGSGIVSSTLLEGASFGIYSIAVDSSGSVYATGTTDINSMPIVGPALQPCAGPDSLVYYFLLKLLPDGSAASYLSYEEAATRMALTADGSVYEANGSFRKLSPLETRGGPFFDRSCVMNGASFASHVQSGQPGISPGELVTLMGTGLGPMVGDGPVISGGVLASTVAGVQVTFDGTPAPLVYVQDRQINVVAPYDLEGKTQTLVEVNYQGHTAAAGYVPVSRSSAALFRNLETGQPLVFNQDFSMNSVSQPAARGSVVALFTTGAGQTSPPSVDGQVWQAAGALATTVTAQIQNINISPLTFDAPVVYAGPVPGVVSAVQQFNILIPPDLPPAFFTPVTSGNAFVRVTIGSQTVTVPVAVR